MWGMPEVVRERMDALDAACAEVDRDPAGIAKSTQALFMLTDDAKAASAFVDAVSPRAAVAGTAPQIAETVAGWQEAGVDELIVPDFVLGDGQQKYEALDELIAAFAPFS
jgi:alkanesulfonate monooxygenase SsuD/methylene tetrahydromethanopterin reductase-like flavin-dependent oxidoreductase (luciferase family)